jgi:hypothetical protein
MVRPCVQEVKGLFPTIEDYMWFQLALVRSGSGSSDGDAPSGAGAVQPATLDALQHYLQQYPPSHYSHQGGTDRRTSQRSRPALHI